MHGSPRNKEDLDEAVLIRRTGRGERGGAEEEGGKGERGVQNIIFRMEQHLGFLPSPLVSERDDVILIKVGRAPEGGAWPEHRDGHD